MGNGVCSRKQKKIFQSLLLVTVVFGMIYGGMVSYEMHKQLKRTEEMSLKYQQHQESLSAQLQGKNTRRLDDVTDSARNILPNFGNLRALKCNLL